MNKLIDTTQTYFFGRSFSETIRCFGFAEAALRPFRVLDCAAGPSCFTADANSRGIRAVAADPMYYRSPGALQALGAVDYESMFRKMRINPELFSFDYFDSFGDAERDRYTALSRFLQDYRDSFPTGRYVTASLPDLPFEDGSFDVALCGHLLFVYAFDYEFHLRAIRELCRVACHEVRIHPVVDASGQTHPFVDGLIRELELQGYSCTMQKVDYTFFKGSDTTLVIGNCR